MFRIELNAYTNISNYINLESKIELNIKSKYKAL